MPNLGKSHVLLDNFCSYFIDCKLFCLHFLKENPEISQIDFKSIMELRKETLRDSRTLRVCFSPLAKGQWFPNMVVHLNYLGITLLTQFYLQLNVHNLKSIGI